MRAAGNVVMKLTFNAITLYIYKNIYYVIIGHTKCIELSFKRNKIILFRCVDDPSEGPTDVRAPHARARVRASLAHVRELIDANPLHLACASARASRTRPPRVAVVRSRHRRRAEKIFIMATTTRALAPPRARRSSDARRVRMKPFVVVRAHAEGPGGGAHVRSKEDLKPSRTLSASVGSTPDEDERSSRETFGVRRDVRMSDERER